MLTTLSYFLLYIFIQVLKLSFKISSSKIDFKSKIDSFSKYRITYSLYVNLPAWPTRLIHSTWKLTQMFEWVLNTPLYMEDNRMLLIDFSKTAPKLFPLFIFLLSHAIIIFFYHFLLSFSFLTFFIFYLVKCLQSISISLKSNICRKSE